jgi:hypothetical protein
MVRLAGVPIPVGHDPEPFGAPNPVLDPDTKTAETSVV